MSSVQRFYINNTLNDQQRYVGVQNIVHNNDRARAAECPRRDDHCDRGVYLFIYVNIFFFNRGCVRARL